ncbi:MAG TPA: sigma-54 dependent transcriptional regulator, partial [Candidatus Ozemobacteraceae bacterium]|nr:sigma-54 dependent transcriptional regulator [Candidatus Ozemobacteraceae bacterium]
MLEILVVDDDVKQAELLSEAVRRLGHQAAFLTSPEEALEQLEKREPDLVITDLRMPKLGGLEFLSRLKKDAPDLEVLLVTGYATVQTAIEAMRRGALDYLEKPVDQRILAAKLEMVAEKVALRRENRRLRDQLERSHPEVRPLGNHPRFRAVVEQLEKAAISEASVLLQGETGTGKEVLARYLHSQSPRASGPFVAVNCSAIPETLLESEFFGHVRGAFTGADRTRPGRVEEAAGGTLFLDEIGDLPLSLQPKLLRVIQNQEYCRVGDDRTRRARVRWVAATHRDLAALVREGRFREDLFYRLAVLPLTIPPLRERPEDILLFLNDALERKSRQYRSAHRSFSPEALEALCSWRWPGNVRELENTVERLVLLSPSPTIDLGDLPEEFGKIVEPAEPASGPTGTGLNEQVEALERRLMVQALEAARGNQSE